MDSTTVYMETLKTALLPQAVQDGRETADVNHMKGAKLTQNYHFWILLSCAAVVAAAFVMETDGESVTVLGGVWPLRCAMHQLTGIKCAFCGMTRSFSLVAHGGFVEAFRMHPVGPLLFSFICMQIPYRLYRIASNRRCVAVSRAGFVTGLAILALVLLQWLIYLGAKVL